MSEVAIRNKNRQLRLARTRSTRKGTAERPRLSVTVSNRHVKAQVIDDSTHTTLAQVTTTTSTVPKTATTMTAKAEWVGSEIAKAAKKAKVSKVVFDRGHKQYHGRIKALADAARKEGLEF